MRAGEAIYWALDILELPVLSTKDELKAAYHTRAKQEHPDCGGSEKKMAEINQAYEILKVYMDNFKFTFSEEELAKQFPEELHVNKFRF